MRTNVLRMTREARWPVLFSLIVMLFGCGRQAADIPKAGGNAGEHVAIPPEYPPPASETPAAKSTPPPIASTSIAETAALARPGSTSEVRGRESPAAQNPLKLIRPANFRFCDGQHHRTRQATGRTRGSSHVAGGSEHEIRHVAPLEGCRGSKYVGSCRSTPTRPVRRPSS